MDEVLENHVVLWKAPQNSLSKLQERLKSIASSQDNDVQQDESIEQENTQKSATIYDFSQKKTFQPSSHLSSLQTLEDCWSEKIIRYLDRQEEHHKRENQGLPTHAEEEIIRTYPEYYHDFLQELLQISKLKEDDNPYTPEELSHFRHNMRWLFVHADQEWFPARLKTLLQDRWTGEEIIRYMMVKKVKYILCHTVQMIQSLDLNNAVVIFNKPS